MRFSIQTTLAVILSFSLVMASPMKRASCSKNRTAKDARCCVWYDVLDDIQEKLFDEGQCDEVAHDALRLTFHDAIGWSSSLAAKGEWPGGGADGSLLEFFQTELEYPGNDGLDDIVDAERYFAGKFLKKNITYGDFVQFAGAVSVRNCAGGPKIPFWAGRPNATQPAPQSGLVPDAGDSVDTILARMADAKFSGDELVALLASHSIGVQEHIDPSVENTPFDTTPQELDSQFYLEVLLNGTLFPGEGPHKPQEALSPLPGEFRLQSDKAIARDPRTACEWQKFMLDEALMQKRFAEVMDKLAIVGHNRADLYDCSEVIPAPAPYKTKKPHLPAGKNVTDIQFSCSQENLRQASASATPSLEVTPGPMKTVPPFTLGHDRLHDGSLTHD